MEEFKFTCHVLNLAHLTFLQGSIGMKERGDDQVINLNGSKQILADNQLNETTKPRMIQLVHKKKTQMIYLGNTKYCNKQWTITGTNSVDKDG